MMIEMIIIVAAVLYLFLFQGICAIRPASAKLNEMISVDFDNKKVQLAGGIDEVGTECAIVLRQLLNKNKESWGVLGAQGVLVNIFALALSDEIDQLKIPIEWKKKEELRNTQVSEADMLKMAMQNGLFEKMGEGNYSQEVLPEEEESVDVD